MTSSHLPADRRPSLRRPGAFPRRAAFARGGRPAPSRLAALLAAAALAACTTPPPSGTATGPAPATTPAPPAPVAATTPPAPPAVGSAPGPTVVFPPTTPAPRPTAAGPRDDDAPEPFVYGRRDDVMRFADEVAARSRLDPAWTRNALAQARFQPQVARFIMPAPSGTAKNWRVYRSRFVEPVRIRAGAAFWQANERWLRRAEAVYGVPPEIVVGIIGVETIYGRQMGNFRVLDALATLAFDFPAGRKDRSAFFRDELEQLLVLAHREGRDAAALKGSYAGAFGMPQFMPSSFVKYAVDFDGDGRIDLHGDAADVIGSVAHYLAAFGWQRGMPARYAVEPPADSRERATLLVPDIVPSFTAAQLAGHGARLAPQGMGHDGLLALVEVQNGDAAPSYVAGTANFYAVTRYNWSSYYALAVIELGEAVARQRQGG